MKRIVLAVALALSAAIPALPAMASAPGDAVATAPSPRLQMMFWTLDRNNDGFIDATEIAAFRTARFQSMDANGDGTLTRAEAIDALSAGQKHHRRADAKDGAKSDAREARLAKRQDWMLKRMGFSDKVDSITLVEFVSEDNPMMKRADADKDGKISKAEFLTAAAKMRHGKGGPAMNGQDVVPN